LTLDGGTGRYGALPGVPDVPVEAESVAAKGEE
jgi:hypothetical protein